jgi:LacI family transcriptional regulator
VNYLTNRKTTIRDVAELVGVHHSTVSRALNPGTKDRISPEMVRKIEKAAEKLGYFPNIAASTLKQNRSFALGVLIPDLTNPVFPLIIRGIQDTAEAEGYTVLTANTDDDETKEHDAFKMMSGRSIDGLIVATARRQDSLVDECIKRGLPLVLVNRRVDREGVSGVIVDEDFGICAALDHLMHLGHRKIAHIAGPQYSSTGYERAKAFRDHLTLHNMEADLIEYADKFTVEEGYRTFKQLLVRDNRFTAIVAGNDTMALGCIDAMHKQGLRCPEDISVVGNNDIIFLSRMNPALTTISIPKYEMGSQATRMLLDIINGVPRETMLLRMQPRLIVRSSTAPVVAR